MSWFELTTGIEQEKVLLSSEHVMSCSSLLCHCFINRMGSVGACSANTESIIDIHFKN